MSEERVTIEVRTTAGGVEEVTMTAEQALSLGALQNVVEVERWHFCVNGCCLIVHEAGFDEHAWFIREDGELEKLDRYGNTIVEVTDL